VTPMILFPGSRLFWRTDKLTGGSTWFGKSTYGHVYRTGHSVFQIQASKDEGASGTFLVSSQHSKGWLLLMKMLIY